MTVDTFGAAVRPVRVMTVYGRRVFVLIDFHTHIFPDKIADKTIEILSANCERVDGRKTRPRSRATLDGLKESMKAEGVDVSVVMPIATTLTQSGSINRFAAEINGRDGVYSFGSLHPMQEDWEDAVLDIKAKGLKGIKLHPEYQRFYIDSPESIRLLKKAEELGLYVTLHAGADIGMPPPVHCAPEQLKHALEFVSGENIIAAHMGGWKRWGEVYELLAGTSIYMDTAFIAQDMKYDEFKRIVNKHGSGKILFATDLPWEAPHETKAFIEKTGMKDFQLENIFHKNAENILCIQDSK